MRCDWVIGSNNLIIICRMAINWTYLQNRKRHCFDWSSGSIPEEHAMTQFNSSILVKDIEA